MKKISPLLFAATPLLSAAIGFFTIPLLTWSMPTQVIAQFGLFQYASSALLIIMTCGFDQAFLRELAGQREPIDLLRKALMPCFFIFGILIIILISWTVLGNEVHLFGTDSTWLTPLLLAVGGLLILQRFGAQQTRMNPNGGLAFLLAELALRMPLMITLVIVYAYSKQGYEFSPFVAVVVGAAFSAIILIAYNYKTWIRILKFKEIDANISTKQLFKFGMPLALAGLLYWFIGNTGPYMLQLLHGDAETARLVVAISIANIATIGQSMFSLIWLPFIYKEIEKGLVPEKLAQVGREVCMGAVFFYIIVVAVLHILQNLLGSEYRSIAPFAAALCVLPVIYTISEVTFVGLMEVRKSGAAFTATLLTFLSSLILNIALVPFYGVAGASIAISISAFVFLLMRTEFSVFYWKPFVRKNIYLGSLSIMLVGVISPWMPSYLGPVALLLLLPYLLVERKIIFKIATEVSQKINKNKFNKNKIM